MLLKFDIKDPSTIRGIVWIIGGIIAIVSVFFKSQEAGVAIMGITASVAGGLGALTVEAKTNFGRREGDKHE